MVSCLRLSKALNDAQTQLIENRWAIKEAAYKSLSSICSGRLIWSSFDLDHRPGGSPQLSLTSNQFPIKHRDPDDPNGPSPSLLSTPNDITFMPSISHDAGVVVGVVLALRSST